MKSLSQAETRLVSAADGYFKVVILTPVSDACANFLIRIYEKIMTNEITRDEAGRKIFTSPFSTHELELALTGIDVVYWNDTPA